MNTTLDHQFTTTGRSWSSAMTVRAAASGPDLIAMTGRAWDEAAEEVRALLQLPADWDGEGADSVRRELIAPTLAFLHQMKTRGFSPPEAVYATAGGSVMVEFHEPSGEVLAANIRTPTEAEVVIRKPGAKPVFRVVPISPRPDFPANRSAGKKAAFDFGFRPDPDAPARAEGVKQAVELSYRLAS